MRARVGCLAVGAVGVLAIVVAVVVYVGPWISGKSAKGLAAVTASWAGPQRMTKIYEYDGRTGIDNRTPFFIQIYQSSESLGDLKDGLLALAQQDGYAARAQAVVKTGQLLSDDATPGMALNDRAPYWRIVGTNGSNDTISIEITDHTYFNPANTLAWGEKPVPAGTVVAVITFTSHECTPEPCSHPAVQPGP